MLPYIDAHNHITATLPIDSIYNSYCLKDVDNIITINKKNKNIGVHPLYIESGINWDLIESVLSSNPINVGEVGLDRSGGNKDEQLTLLRQFISLANRYNKSVTFHCVKSWGVLNQVVKVEFNRDLPHIFHGFSGSYETMKELLGGNSFFSFSLRELKRDRIKDVIKSIPIEKLLIESDMLSNIYGRFDRDGYLEQMALSYDIMSKVKSVSYKNFIPIIYNNFNCYLKES